MKAVICAKYGPPEALQLKEVEKPTPKDNEVLVQIRAAAVNYSSLALVEGKPFLIRLMGGGLLQPKYRIPGCEIAGRVEAVGKNARQFKVGNEVFGDLSDSGRGGFAEYVSVPESALALKPANITFEEAATVSESALVALQGLRDMGQIRKGQKVLIYGASGGIGTFAVQIAKSFEAEVTGVCSTRNLALVRSIGADHVVDYTKEDFTRSGQLYDLILATIGYRSIFDYRRALTPRGIHVVTGGAMAQIFQAMLLGPWISMIERKKFGSLLVKPNKDLDLMKELIETGKVKPVIDRCYPLSQASDALRYYGSGHVRGKVVVTV